jgi:phage terminase large subunit-like protein
VSAPWLDLDPVRFVSYLRNPETGRPFELFEAETSFLREALTPGPDGRLLYPELLYGAIKKSGKTMVGAWCVLYVVLVLGGRYAEGYCLANDLEQTQSRVFQAIVRLVESTPALKQDATITATKITFRASGSTIVALAADYAGAAGANPSISCFDELWGYTSERAQRLWDEMVPSPARLVSVRLTTTLAGFEGESRLLEGQYKRLLQGEEIAPRLFRQPGMLGCWHHEPIAPWQTPEWIEQMRQQLRVNAFLRLIENRWVSGEEQFVPIEWWDRAATSQPIVADRSLPVVLGADFGLKHDSSAIVVTAWDQGKVRLVSHKIFTPVKGEILNIEETIEAAIREYAQRFRVTRIRFDPWQAQRTAELLKKAGLPMEEYPQSVPNLTQMSSNLSDLLKGGNLIGYPDVDIRLALQRAVSVEGARGTKISKEKASHRIDVVVALAMAALGTVQKQPTGVSSASLAAALGTASMGLSSRTLSRPELSRGPEYLGPNSSQPGGASKWR